VPLPLVLSAVYPYRDYILLCLLPFHPESGVILTTLIHGQFNLYAELSMK
jgi:hypothetical protein